VTAHDWFIDNRTSFVVRTLEPDEERCFLAHLGGCAECRREIAAIERDLDWLPMAATPAVPPPGLVHQVVEHSLGRYPRRQSPMTLIAVAASVVLVIGTVVWAAVSVRDVRRTVAAERRLLEREVTSLRDTLAIMQSADRVRHAAITMGAQQGGMVIFVDDRSHRWNVVVYGVTVPSPGEVLQFWFITEDGMVRGVEVKPHGTGPAFLTVEMPAVGGKVMGAALTMEPTGDAVGPPSGPELAHLIL
jgi:hypothetical protein